MYNDAPDSSARVDFRNRAFQLGNSISFDREKGIRNISLDYSFQTSGDSDPAKTSSSLKSHNMTIRGLYFPYGNIGVIPTINIIDTRQADAGWTLTRSYNIGINIQSFDKRLNNNFTTGITLNGSTSSMKIGLRSSCKLTRSALLSAQIDTNHFKSDGEAGNFTETTARLTATQRF